MEFSQSMGFGDSTLLKLENDLKCDDKENSNEQKQAANGLDIIQESPTAVKGSNKSQRFMHTQSYKANITQRHKFRRSKSNPDTRFASVQKDASENYSKYFEDEFSCLKKSEKQIETHKESLCSVKALSEEKIAAAVFEDSAFENSFSVFEAQICTEDVNSLLESETEPEFCSFKQPTAKSAIGAPELASLDESCFICPVRDDEASQQLQEDLKRSHCELAKQQSYEPTKMTQNLSSMSPSQLRLSPTCPKSPNQAAALPTEVLPDLESLKAISAWQLPQSVLTEYKRKGVLKMFDWQVECLSKPKVLFEHCNLVYSAPTSAGKTLVSEILLLKTVLERKKKVLLILPFISVVREKMFYLQDLLTTSGYRVEGFFGGYTPPGGFDSIHVAICTIEKANSIVNKLLEQGKLDEIGTVVVDEVHLISDPGRGYILELLLAKILYMSRKHGLQIQVITMSATLANVHFLQRWLDAELYITDYRPVALQEMIKIGNKIYDNKLTYLRDVTQIVGIPPLGNDSDHVALLCIETLLDGCSVIVFCPSKDWCENLAVQLASALHVLIKSGTELGQRLRQQLKPSAIEDVKRQLRDIPTGLDSVMSKAVTYACAFHHAGLTTEERDIVEASFKIGALKVLVATSTLSSGVNLPARRVLIRSPLFGGKQMSSLTYRQMIGRAGRTGRDTLGESILICTDSNARIGRELIAADLKPISSCLELDSSTHLKRALLEVISSGVASTKQDIDSFVNCTLLSAQKALAESGDEEEANYINDALDFLVEYEFIRLQAYEESDEQIYVATRLGAACLASSMPPTDGLILFAELQKSRRCFVLESELHAVYLVTPYSVCYQLQDLDWLLYLDMWEKLNPAMKKVGELVGVKEVFLVRAMRGQSKLDYKMMQIHKRFYTALALQELVNETPINVVGHKFKCTRGMLQSLQQMSSTFAGIVTAFCNSLQWSTLSLIVSQFKDRLYFGIHRDLIDLMRLPDLTQKRARVLYDAGITSLVELAGANVSNVEKILFNSLSFDLAKQLDHENAYEANQRNEERNFFITGKAGMTVSEAAKLLISQSRQFVKYDIGVDNIKWTQMEENASNNVDSGIKMELHMSVEEEDYSAKGRTKRKALEEKIPHQVSPPKARKLEPPISESKEKHLPKETTKHSKDKVMDDAPGVKQKERRSTIPIKEPALITKNKPEKTRMPTTSKMPKHNDGVMPLRNSMTSEIKEKLPQKSSEVTKSEPNKASKNTFFESHTTSEKPEPQRKEALSKTTESKQNTVSRIKVPEKLITAKLTTTDPQLQAKNSTIGKPKQISSEIVIISENPRKLGEIPDRNATKSKTPEPLPEEKPSTSEKLRQELLKKEMDDRRRVALIRIEASKRKRLLSTDSNGATPPSTHMAISDKENAATNNIPTQNHAPASNQISGTSNALKIVSKANEEPTQLPRSCGKDQPIANDTQQATAAEQDLFMNDDSFMMNTGITAAITAAESKDIASSVKPNIESDEIPSSQQLESTDASKCGNSASRTLRSHQLRSQIVPSPKQRAPLTKPCSSNSASSSIELSDISLENSLIKLPQHLNASHIMSCSKIDEASSFNSIDIINICGNMELFLAAFKELRNAARFGFSIAVEAQAGALKPIIGGNLLLNQVAAKERRKASEGKGKKYFQINDTTFIAGMAFSIKDNVVCYMDTQDVELISNELQTQHLVGLLECSELTLLMHEAKEMLKMLRHALPQLEYMKAKVEDPKVANWLLQPDRIVNFHNMCQQFAPECTALVNLLGSGRGYSSYGLDCSSTISPKTRASIEACVTVHILKGQNENLERIGAGQLLKFFREVEMPLQVSLYQMEYLGFPVKLHRLQRLCHQITSTTKKLETKIYELNGARFNLSCTKSVAKVLGLHYKTKGRGSTSRQILEKLDSPIANMLINYRKLNVINSKNIQPLLICCKESRVHGQSLSFTATGRISMSEPNLQNVAKDVEIDFGAEKLNISCRSVFAPTDEKRCLLSADFCQLEMRILAHLSQDKSLLNVMKSPQDLFKAIAAHWNHVEEAEVSEAMRNNTKQICYGIVYGMGMRSLAVALMCSEQEAQMVSEQFHTVYPGIRVYAAKVVKFARHNGYVETITGRRRYLDNINSGEPHAKSERQAINTTIQGSAADIAKTAILRMEKNIERYREKLGIAKNEVNLVLHVHDELIFEVPTHKAKKVAKVLQLTMEQCVQLSVPLKVKLKIGPSWGELAEIKI